jgi:hypothetical protein
VPVRSGTKAVWQQVSVTDLNPFLATEKKRKATLPSGCITFVDLVKVFSVFAVEPLSSFLVGPLITQVKIATV